MSEPRDDLREALARAIFERGRKQGGIDPETWEVAGDEMQAWLLGHADAMIAGPFAPILAQVSALQAEVERLQKVEGEREKGRVPDGTGLSPDGEAAIASSSQSDFDPSRGHHGSRVIIWHTHFEEYWLAPLRGVTEDATKAHVYTVDEALRTIADNGVEIEDVELRQPPRASDEHPAGEDAKRLSGEAMPARSASADAPSDNPLTETKEGSEHV